jgi:dihydroxyacetone kinase-like protein
VTKNGLDPGEVRQMLLAVTDRIIASEPLLSEADRHLGDGDHGLGMARGMAAVKAKLETNAPETIAGPFAVAGLAMLSSMGGASGALFGTMFRSGGKALERREVFDSAALADFLEAALTGVTARGGAAPGDKTMVDALQPAAAKARETVTLPLAECASAVAAAAELGKQATQSMLAKVGRAKALGQGSLGHPDAGAISVSLILGAMLDYIQGPNTGSRSLG